MNVKECIKAAMAENGYTQKAVAEKVGKNQSDIAMYLSRADTMRLENLMLIMNACDYDVAFVNRRDRSKMYIVGEGKADTAEEKSYTALEQDPADVKWAIRQFRAGNEALGKHQGSSDTLEDMIRRVVQEELSKR